MRPVNEVGTSPVRRQGLQRSLAVMRRNAIVVSFVALFLILSISANAFLSVRNMLNILDQAAQVGIIACGMTVVIIGGGFDLSVGAIFAISGVTAAVLAIEYGAAVGMLAGVAVGLAIGLLNGLVIARLRVNSFIATLASSLVIRGVGLVAVSGRLITVDVPYFNILGRGELLSAKVSVYLFAVVILMAWFLLARTTLGRRIFAVGGNAVAARLSGVRVELVTMLTFGFSGLCAGIAGVLGASRISTGLMNVGSGLELDAIAAVVIGGTSIMGGEGAVWRTVLGVLLLRLILNGFNILTVEPFYQQIFQGLIILVAVAIDTLPRRTA